MPRGSASKKTALAREQERPDVARKRERWKARQGSIDPKRLVFIDETWAKTNMAPLRGWAARGQRLIGRAVRTLDGGVRRQRFERHADA